MRAGGYPIWIVLALALPMLYLGVRFAIAADARRLAMLRGLTWAQLFAVGSGVASNVMAVMYGIGRGEDPHDDLVHRLCIGLGESLAPAVLGLSALTVSWILISFGLRRMSKSELEP